MMSDEEIAVVYVLVILVSVTVFLVSVVIADNWRRKDGN